MTAEDTLADSGLHFDDLNKLRVLEPENAQQTGELKEECQEFVGSKKFYYALWFATRNTASVFRSFFGIMVSSCIILHNISGLLSLDREKSLHDLNLSLIPHHLSHSYQARLCAPSNRHTELPSFLFLCRIAQS